MKKMGFSNPIDLLLESSRIVEHPWVLRNIPSKGRILDVGSTGSQLPLMFAVLGYEVWTIDIRKYDYDGIINNLNCTVGDIMETNFQDSFFDIVLATSTIEHIGLGRYGDIIDSEGDRKSIEEIRRIITNGGVFLMTVPFGRPFLSRRCRIYNNDSLLALLRNFHIENIEYFLRTNNFWIKSTIDQVKNIDSSLKDNAIACVKSKAIN